MFSPLERMIALRYLRARRREGFVSVIAGFSLAGITLGVATLIIVMAVMNGFRQDLIDRILGFNGHMVVRATDRAFSDSAPLAAAIRTVPGVATVTPLVEGQVMLSARGMSSGVMVRGVAAADLVDSPLIADSLVDGSVDSFGTGQGVMVGLRMAERYNLSLGDEITLIAPRGHVTAFGTAPRVRSYPVTAIFSVGMSEYDSAFVYMPLDLAQTYFRYPDQVTAMEIMLTDPEKVRDLTFPVRAAVEQVVPFGARLYTWQETNSQFFNALAVERNVMFLILTLIILVAAFNIVSGLIMMVKDKGRNIAILRTMGATRGAILRIFFITGASVGVLGTLGGLALGVLFCENIEAVRRALEAITGAELFPAEIYFLSTLPAKMDWNETLSVVLMALGLSFAATLYPAWRAAVTDPVEALRYE